MKINTVITLVASAIVFLFTPITFAAENNNNTGSGPNPYKDCGIGAALFPETNWAAVSSNVIWDLGTTALISATASPETCSGKNVKAAQFILDTYDNLVEETSQGKGEHLTTVMNIMECNQTSHNAIASDIRKGAATVVNSSNYDSQPQIEKASMMFNVVFSATQGCSV